MTEYSEAYRRQCVDRFRQSWETSGIGVLPYCEQQLTVHHTSFRKWIEKYDPELMATMKAARSSRKRPETNKVCDRIADDTPKPSGLEVVSETYPASAPTANVPATIDDHPAVLELHDRIAQLQRENHFLKQQVSYWLSEAGVTHQEGVL